MVHPVHRRKLTRGERAADRLAAVVGSWTFLITQAILIVIWMIINVYVISHLFSGHPFDPYPFILLNLCLSLQAAFTGPVLQLSGNRQASIDRARGEHDYSINLAAIRAISKLATTLDCDISEELAEVQHLLTEEHDEEVQGV